MDLLNQQSYMRDTVRDMVEYMSGMVKYSENEIKTLIAWAIGTYAHEELSKFPILRLTSTTHTGKTNATKFVADISRCPRGLGGEKASRFNFQEIKGSTEASIRELIALGSRAGGTCCFDEADDFPFKYYESIFDKDGSQTYKMDNKDGGYTLDDTINLWAPVMMNGRTFLEDESHQNRTIEITTFSDIEWSKQFGHEYSLGHYAHFRDSFSEFAKTIDWEGVSEGSGTRASQCWAPLKAVAKSWGDEDFLGYIESQIEKSEKDSIDGRAEEIDYKVIETMIGLCWQKVEVKGLNFPNRLKLKEIAEGSNATSKTVGKTLRLLGVKTSKSGVMWAVGLNPEKLGKLCERAGVRHDDWLEGQIETNGFLD